MPSRLPPSLRAVLFDLDGTLRHNDPAAHDFFFDFAVSLGLPDSPASRRAAFRWAHTYWSGAAFVDHDTALYGADTPAFWDNYARGYLLAFGCTPAQADELAPQVNAHMRDNYRPTDRLETGAAGTLASLREAGYTLGVVSNRGEPFGGLLEELSLLDLFDFHLAAGEVQSWKPDPGIFHHSLQMAGAAAGEAVYIGDNYYADVLGARSAGLHAILFDPDTVFPHADCPVITAMPQLLDILAPQAV